MRVAVVADVVRSYVDLQAARRQLQVQQELAGLDARRVRWPSSTSRRGSAGRRVARWRRTGRPPARHSPAARGADRAAHALAVLLGRYAPDPG